MALTIPRTFSGSASARQNQVIDLLGRATTQAEINQILTAARSSSTTIDNAAVNAANARVAAAARPATPAPAPAAARPATPAPAPAAPAVVNPPASLNLPDAATAMRLIVARDPKAPPTMRTDSKTGIQYHLIPPTGSRPAEWVTVAPGSTRASNGQTVTQINTNQTAYIAANAQPIPRPTTTAATPAQPAPSTAQQQQYEKIAQAIRSFTPPASGSREFSATGTGSITYVPADPVTGTAAGYYIPADGGLRRVNATSGAPEGPVLTSADFNSLVRTTTANITQANVQREQQQAQLTQNFQTQLSQAQTAADVDRVVQQARTQGVILPEASINRQKTTIESSAKLAGEIASVAQTTPTAATNKFTASGQEMTYLPADPVTGQPGSWFTVVNGQFQKIDSQGRATGAPIPGDVFNQQQRTVTQNLEQTARTQAEQQRAAEARANEFITRMAQAPDQASWDAVKNEASRAGITLNQGQLSQSQAALTNRLQQAESARISQLNTQYDQQLRDAVAANDQTAFDRVLEQARAAGAQLTDQQISARQSTLNNNLQVIQNQQRQALTSQLGDQLRGVETSTDLDRLVQQAGQQGITFTQAQLEQARNRVTGLDRMYGEIADAVRGGFSGNKFTASGAELVNLPADPVTGRAGGVYMVTGQGLRAVGADGRPMGDVVSADQFNQTMAETTQNIQNFQRDQAEAQRLAQITDDVQRFEAGLPQPGSEQFNYLLANRFVLTGPDGRSYELVAKDEKTGAPAHWIRSVGADANYSDPNTRYQRLDNPDTVVQKGAVDQMFQTNAQIQNARAHEERARLIAEQRRAQDIDVGEMTRFIAGTLAVIGGAALLANYGPAMYDKIVETVATMAEGGSSAGDIANVLETVYDIPTELASNLGETAIGAVEEAVVSLPNVTPPPGYENVFEFGFPEAAIPPTPPVGPESVFEFGFPEAAIPPTPPVGPESVFEFGFPEAPVSPPTAPPVPAGPESVLEYGFPETPTTPTAPATPPTPETVFEAGFPEAPPAPTTPTELPQPIEYPPVEPPVQGPIEVAQGPGTTMTDVPVGEQPLRIEITGLPEQTPVPEGLDYPDLGPPDYVYEPTIEPTPFGESGPAPTTPGFPTAPAGPETVFEFGFPEVPVPPVPPALPGPGTTFEFGFPEAPTLPGTPSLPPAMPGPETTFEFGFPETPTGPATPAPGPGTTFEFGFPETTPMPGAGPTPTVPGPETTFEFGYPPAPVTPAPPPLPGPSTVFEYGYPTTPGPENVFEYGYPTTTPPPGPDNVFEYGYPTTTPPPGPDNVFEYGYPEPTPEPPPYDYIDSSTVVPDRPIIDTIIDTIKDIPIPPVIPIIPVAPQPPGPRTYEPLEPIEFGTIGRVNLPGVNPGFFTTPTPYYQTTSPVQARYSYRQRPLQTGSEYSAARYNAPEVGPAQPFGLREMYRPMDIQSYLAALNAANAPVGTGRR